MIAAEPEARRYDHVASWVMGAATLGILVCVPFVNGHSSPSVDSRTHIEMIRGVAEHGLPYTSNGAIALYPELHARWNVPNDGRLWGMYPPLFAYVAAPFFRLGGLVAVSRMNVALLVAMLWGAFALARRFLNDRLLAAAASVLVLLATPTTVAALDIGPFILAQTLFVWSMALGLHARDVGGRKALWLSGASGLSSALATASHLVIFPMVVGLLLATMLAADAGEPEPVLEWKPLTLRFAFRRTAAMLAGLTIGLLPLAILNHVRFHSFNPISYGPCVWRSCAETGIEQQHLSNILLYALPTLLWASVVLAIAVAGRRDRRAWAVAAIAAIFPLIVMRTLRVHTWQLGLVAFGDLFDLTWIDMPPFASPADGVGHVMGPWVVRSLFQCTPLLLLAPFVPFGSARARGNVVMLAFPTALLFFSCILRANMPLAFAFGFPFVFLRYVVPASVPLTILAIAGIRSLTWRRSHFVVLAILTLGFTAWLALGTEYDGPLVRRLFLLYGTLGAGLFAVFMVWRAKAQNRPIATRTAPFAVVAAIAFGIASNVGVTFPAIHRLREDNDKRLDSVASLTPNRFALVGFAGEIDTVLALRATRDIEYLDLYETDQTKGWGTFDALIDDWTREGRPIFALWPAGTDLPSPWTDVAFERISVQENLYRIRKL